MVAIHTRIARLNLYGRSVQIKLDILKLLQAQLVRLLICQPKQTALHNKAGNLNQQGNLTSQVMMKRVI